MKSYTPLRYPGGKAKLYTFITEILQNNFDVNPVYVEPFAGGAGLALKLLINEKVSKVYINDLDYSIYAFWYSILNHHEEFIKKIETVQVNIHEWHKQKEIYLNKDKHSIFDIGFSTFFLNRTNRSGILIAGPIGGYSQNGNYKMDCRFNKDTLIEIINDISQYKNKIFLSNLDAKEFVKQVDDLEENAFIYLDPPYVQKGSTLYKNSFEKKDHEELFLTVSNLKNKWFVTYDNNDLVLDLYKNYDPVKFNIRYAVQNKRMAEEIAVFSYNTVQNNRRISLYKKC